MNFKYKAPKKIKEYATKYNENIASLSELQQQSLMARLGEEQLLHIAAYLATEPSYPNKYEVQDEIKYVCWLAHWLTYDDTCNWITFADYKKIINFSNELNTGNTKETSVPQMNFTQTPPESEIPGTSFVALMQADNYERPILTRQITQNIGETPELRERWPGEPDLGGGFNQWMWRRGQEQK